MMFKNPEFIALARRKALVGECITHLSHFTSMMGESAQGRIISEDVPREVSEVPEEDVNEFINDLQQEHETLRLELAKFDLVKRDQNEKHLPSKTTEASSGGTAAKGKRRRRTQK